MKKEKTIAKKIDGTCIEYVNVAAFGRTFKGLFPEHAKDLITLETEGAIYVNHYDKKSGRFNFYRIKFLPKEIFEYVEAHIAHQEFFEGLKKYNGDFTKALEHISNKNIAERVRNYEVNIEKNGKKIKEDLRGCFASFMGKELEELVCSHVNPTRYELLPKINAEDKIAIILNIFESISENINFLVNRKHNRPSFKVENEYDLQDLLHVIIKSIFPDARLEEFTIKHAGKTKRIDIVIPSIMIVIEVKYVRDKKHANSVADEIKIDIESYHVHPNCKTLCVLIYDPQKYIIDPRCIMKDLSGLRVIKGKQFEIKTIVKN